MSLVSLFPDSVVTGWAVLASGTPSPSPTQPGAMPDPDTVTPGALAFVVMFLLGVAIWLLLRNLTGRLRRMRYREEQRLRAEQLAAAEAEDRRWAEEQDAKRAGKVAPPSEVIAGPRAELLGWTSAPGPGALVPVTRRWVRPWVRSSWCDHATFAAPTGAPMPAGWVRRWVRRWVLSREQGVRRWVLSGVLRSRPD